MDSGGIKPEPSSKESAGSAKKSGGQGNRDYAAEASNPDQAPEEGGWKPALAEKAKDKAANASETAKDVRDVAKAGPTGLESTGKEIKEGAQKDGVKGAAGAAGREAAGQAVATGLDVATAGATAKMHGKVAKGVSKALKKENLKKILIGVGIILALPLIITILIIVIFINFANNPVKFASKVLTDPKQREFALQGAKAMGKGILSDGDFYSRYGFVDKKAGSTYAAPGDTAAPKPGSIEEKMLKINIKNARYQYNSAPSCPYAYTTKEMVNPKTGEVTSVIDQVKNSRGEVVDKDSFLVYYCIFQSMPIYNMMVRTQKAREVNGFSDTVLNYGDSLDSKNIKQLSKEGIEKYVYDKTYQRITSKNNETPRTNIADVNDYINAVRQALLGGKDPDDIKYEFKNSPDSTTNIAKTLCTFQQGYLSDENIRKGIYSRLNAGQRSGVKWNTLASTRELGQMPNDEVEPTMKQIDGWQNSRAYFQNVYAIQGGEQIDPERLGNTSYGSSYADAISLLFQLEKSCKDINQGNVGSLLKSIASGLPFVRDPKTETDARKEVIAIYDALRETIVVQSNGKFTNIDDFGLEQLMIGVIRMGGGAAVSGLEDGPQNFNNQSQGFRTLSNQYMMRMGGRFLSKTETAEVDFSLENTRREMENKNGIAYRLFGEDNLRSVANVIKFEAPKNQKELKTKSREYIAKMTSPIKMLADLHSGFSYIVLGKSNQAFAAESMGDSYMRINTVGLTDSDFGNTNLVNNSNEVQSIIENGTPAQKTAIGYFEKCTKANIPTTNFFIRKYPVRFKEDSTQAEVDSSKPIFDTLGNPVYPVISDDPKNLGLTDKRELAACEIYLMPTFAETKRDYINNQGRLALLFPTLGSGIVDLARKYRLYLYANSMVDLMVELSNKNKTDAIYANGADPNDSGASVTDKGAIGDIGLSSDDISCPGGTNDLGVADSNYTGSLKREPADIPIKIRLCQIPDIPGVGNDAKGNVVTGGIVVNSRVANAWLGLARAAKLYRISLSANSSFRLADSCGGTGDGNICARPGSSPHQLGVGVDFNGMSKTGSSDSSCSGRARLPGNAAWEWLFQNAEKWGIEQYSNEAWHWDLVGSVSRCNSKE